MTEENISTDVILSAFKQDLEAKKLTTKTIDKHMINAENFYDFIEDEQMEPPHYYDALILSFLGDYYIRKYLFSSKSDVGPYLATFKKLADTLSKRNWISPEENIAIKDLCKEKAFFMHRFDTYETTTDFLDWTFENDPNVYHQTTTHTINREASSGLDVDDLLVAPLKTIDFDQPPFFDMFNVFLKNLDQKQRHKVTNGTQHLTRAFWKEFDETNGLNLFTKPTLNQRDIPPFHLLYVFAEAGDFFIIDGNFLIPTDFVTDYLNAEIEAQVAYVMEVFWHGVDWRLLDVANGEHLLGCLQVDQINFADILSAFPPGEAIKADHPLFKPLLDYTSHLRPTLDSFFLDVLPAFEPFGLVKLDYNNYTPVNPVSFKELSAITVTPLGHVFFSIFKDMADAFDDDDENDFFRLILDSL
ncbi:hypothetical protein HMI01_27920 [Halolactibacillus miurensis]|uniref:Uncharacterized protein n=1 Tax=Halolactibacillus miurensis TaxID=306541 RepID=A0A1I6V409_9BACI|nr:MULTISPECIES: hypothetical protein [Halolactibacillus]GEM05804.1 hypothetical protein HMI01_27920 [Halolactibacillus miurensis]SFT08327.1 hypothetical protein SAMN05421668_1438 [Halolactibacillus miurensis]